MHAAALKINGEKFLLESVSLVRPGNGEFEYVKFVYNLAVRGKGIMVRMKTGSTCSLLELHFVLL
jgi:hypothetical protein